MRAKKKDEPPEDAECLNKELNAQEETILRNYLVDYFVSNPIPNHNNVDAESLVVQIVPAISKRAEYKNTIFARLPQDLLTRSFLINHSMERVIKNCIEDRYSL